MLNAETVQLFLSYLLLGASIIAILLAVSSAKGSPLKAMFSFEGYKSIPKKFFLMMGFSFFFLSLFNLLAEAFVSASVLILLASLQFRHYSSKSNT